jgi:hypothetical protein
LAPGQPARLRRFVPHIWAPELRSVTSAEFGAMASRPAEWLRLKT